MINKERDIRKKLGNDYPINIRIPYVVYQKLKKHGYNMRKLIRIKLVETLLEDESDSDLQEILLTNKKGLRDGE